MSELLIMLAVFVLSIIIGYLLISKVPNMLHTPLMSMTNAISAVTILGALLVFAVKPDLTETLLGAAAIALAAFNVVGGFTITERMLRMFKSRKE
ncbi:MAG TPA: NAD(P) transhydrogenase subunit alpha [Bacteroidales bacterium]|jgi:NAD(P) transhydrogenase subunit alpha|nr:NAD(P) transhydrogenase subunit alpha [Bacteroidales bacterium]HQH24050.1 NAD(P) transhydrogenase subunit alpha [Bacteroidales bacterium]HQJ83213.1 NAD(P) transhydrogenase subunit alpha [Bacteroidales bacterium]